MQTDEESEIFDIQKGSKQGDPLSSLPVQHGAAVCIKKRDPEMAKKKGNGYLLERPNETA